MKYEDLLLIDFILEARHPVSAKDILDHLRYKIEGFAEQQGNDQGLRNIQNRLKKLQNDEHLSSLIDVTDEGRRKLYRGSGRYRRLSQEMTIEQACALLMADKHLSAIAPNRLLNSQEHYQDLIDQASAVVRKTQTHRIVNNQDIASFMNRVTVMQRGQRLESAVLNDHTLACIAECIVKRRCIKLSYKGKDREMHPFGLVFRQPKVYLLALDTDRLKETGPARARPRQFLCNRIENASVSSKAHEVPEDFDIEAYVNDGRLDLMAFGNAEPGSKRFTLKLRVNSKGSNNLIRDLEEYPLSSRQSLEKQSGTAVYQLTAPGMLPTHTLVDWIMGRLDNVEVIEPPALRKHVSDKVRAMYEMYHA